MSTELQERRKQYVTVEEACLLTNRSERTIRRWVEKRRVNVIRDQFGFVRIDLDDILRMQASKPDTVHPVSDEIKRIVSNEESQEQRIQKLESLVAILLEREEVLEKRVDALLSQQRVGAANLVLLPHRSSHESSAESHGFPAGTVRLVSYVGRHEANINEVKALHSQRMIDLTIHIREGEPKRNKQEWWITPEQQAQLVRYWQEHHVPYTPCAECQGCMEQVQNSEIG